MKTSNLVALMVALLVSTGGFEGINILFATAYYSHAKVSPAPVLHA